MKLFTRHQIPPQHTRKRNLCDLIDFRAVWSPPISPLKGKLYFDWNQHGIRADIQQGDGAPWELKTTLLYHPNKVQQGANTFNITWGVYLFLSPGK